MKMREDLESCLVILKARREDSNASDQGRWREDSYSTNRVKGSRVGDSSISNQRERPGGRNKAFQTRERVGQGGTPYKGE